MRRKIEIITNKENNPYSVFDALVAGICKDYPCIEFQRCKNAIIKASVQYRFGLAEQPYVDRKEYVDSLSSVCDKARDLLIALENLDINGMNYVMSKWNKRKPLQKKPWIEICEWLKALSEQSNSLYRFSATLTAKPGVRATTKDAEILLIKSIDEFIITFIPDKNMRLPLVRKIALGIHQFTTGENKPQKFRRIQKDN